MRIRKVCPKCNRKYEGLEVYCTKCGVKLEKARNCCSEMNTTFCERCVLEDDDMYCPYCGSLSTYAKEQLNG